MKKFLCVILTILLVFPLILSSLVIYPLTTLILDRDFYIDTFSSDEIQAILFSDKNIEMMFSESFGDLGGADQDAFKSLVQSLISKQYYQDQIAAIVNQVFDFLEGDSDSLSLQIDLSEIKDAFNGPNQQELLEELVKILPICLDAQMTQDSGIILCKPATVSDEDYIESFLKPNLPLLLAFMPEKMTILEPISRNDLIHGIPTFFQPYLTLSGLKTAILVLAAITVLLWFLIAWMAGDNGKERLLWLGWTLFIPSILILISGIVLKQNFVWDLLEFRIGQNSYRDLSNLFSMTGVSLQSLYFLIIEKISSLLTLISGITASIGLGFIAWGAVHSKNN